jgi:phasin family protein
MFAIPEPFSAAAKTQFEAQLAILQSLAGSTFEGVKKIADLNLNVIKTSLQESSVAMEELLTAKDPQTLYSLGTSHAQPNTEKFIAYSRHLAAIASGTQAEWAKVAETQIAETNDKVLALIDELGKNAPAGSEKAIAAVKSAMGNAQAGYDQLTKTAREAVSTLEGNLTAAATQFSNATGKATTRSRKTA